MAQRGYSFYKALPLILTIIMNFVIVASPPAAFARFELVPGSRYTSVRAASLADAALALSDDGMFGLFYQPANLLKVRNTKAELTNFTLGAGAPYVSEFFSPLKVFDALNLQQFTSTLDTKPGVWSDLGLAVAPAFSFPGLSLGVLWEERFAAKSNGDGSYAFRSLYQLIPALGTGLQLFKGVLRLGYSLQWVNKAEGARSSVSGAQAAFDERLYQGSALSHLFGLTLALPTRGFPALNFVARNCFTTRYSDSSFNLMTPSLNSVGPPPDEPTSYDLSLSFVAPLGQQIISQLIVEGRDLSGISGMPWIGRMALGLEFAFSQQVFFRFGLSSAYPSLGLALRHQHHELSLGWVSEEMGSSYLSERAERYVLQYHLR